MAEQKPPPAGEPGQPQPPQPPQPEPVITGDGSDVSLADDLEFDESGSTIDFPPSTPGDDFAFDPSGPEYTFPPENSESMTTYVGPTEGFVRMFPTAPSDVRDVPPGGIPQPEPLPTFAPDTASDQEAGERNVPPGGIPQPEKQAGLNEVIFPEDAPDYGGLQGGLTQMFPPESVDTNAGTYVDYAEPQEGFIQMFPTKLVPPDVRDVPPGELPQPEPLHTFAPDTASDVPAGADQQQPAGNDSNLLDPNLFDPIAPGPTLDTGLFDRITQSPELVNLLNQNPALAEALEQNPAYLDQIEQHLDVGEQQQWSIEPSSYNTPTDYTDWGLTDPSRTDPDTAGQDVHEHDDFLEGV